MHIEIERKYLVVGEFKHLAYQQKRITQAYLVSSPERTVRIRISDETAFITIKGRSLSNKGMSRMEWEKEIPYSEAKELLNLCLPGAIDKTRYLVKLGNHTVEVDEFYGDNQGLLMAEIELQHEDEQVKLPEWLGLEVTNDRRYYNGYLSQNPYSKW